MPESNHETSSGTKVTIALAIIGLIGTLGAAFLSNIDKIFPTQRDGSTTTVPTTESSSKAPTPGGKVESFVGHWRNENKDTSDITKVDIDSRLDQIIIRVWGKCSPNDCDWGTQSVPQSDSDSGLLQISWNPGFSIIKQQIKLLPDGRLEVSGHTHFTDNSQRPDYTSVTYFVKM